MRRLTESQQLLGDAEWTLRDFLYWPTQHHYTLGALWTAAASLRDVTGEFQPFSIGRPLFVSELGNTGKTLSTRIMCKMVPGGELVLNPTSFGVQAVLNENGCPGVEEFDKKVGIRAMRNQDLYTIILGGYNKDANVIQQRNDKSDRVNVSGPLILNGNNANMILHHQNFHPLVTRSHVFLLDAAPDDVYLTEYMPEIHNGRFEELRKRFRDWGKANWQAILSKPIDELGIDPRIRNRQKEIWVVLYRVAQFVGGDWPKRCEDAAKALVLGIYNEEDNPVISSTEEMLWAVRAVFRDDEEWLPTDDILDRLCRLPQQPKLLHEWKTYKASTMGLAKVMRVFDIEHERHSVGGEQQWGYNHADLYEDGIIPASVE